MSEGAPEPDRIPGVPHPRETQILIGQDTAIADFLETFNAGRVHSGWLLTGPKGIGKATLAWKIATFLLAQPTEPDAGLFGAPPPTTSLDVDPDHTDARLIAAGAHPRLHVVRRPVDDKTGNLRADITVDTVRAMKGFFQMSAADGGRRVVIVDAADDLNRNAANAILKELEEPPEDTTILMIAHQPSGLLPTIRSRCRALRLNTLGPDDLNRALAQAGVEVDQTEALAALAGGSVGDAVRLVAQDGLAIYAEIVNVLSDLPHMARPALLRLAESCAGKANEGRRDLVLDLMDQFLSRTAMAGLNGEPDRQGAPGEARLLARISPDANAARAWATRAQDVSGRARHGRAVNLDPAALILDMFFAIEETARQSAAS